MPMVSSTVQKVNKAVSESSKKMVKLGRMLRKNGSYSPLGKGNKRIGKSCNKEEEKANSMI